MGLGPPLLNFEFCLSKLIGPIIKSKSFDEISVAEFCQYFL